MFPWLLARFPGQCCHPDSLPGTSPGWRRTNSSSRQVRCWTATASCGCPGTGKLTSGQLQPVSSCSKVYPRAFPKCDVHFKQWQRHLIPLADYFFYLELILSQLDCLRFAENVVVRRGEVEGGRDTLAAHWLQQLLLGLSQLILTGAHHLTDLTTPGGLTVKQSF